MSRTFPGKAGHLLRADGRDLGPVYHTFDFVALRDTVNKAARRLGVTADKVKITLADGQP